jgi:hypothetical protein
MTDETGNLILSRFNWSGPESRCGDVESLDIWFGMNYYRDNHRGAGRI